LTVLLMVPSMLGVALGLRARHHDDQGLGALAVLANAMVGLGWIVLSAVQVASN
jgi:hypothetical protein